MDKFTGTANFDGQLIVMNDKIFSTGSTGYHGVGKVFLDGKKYQANVMLIAVGSRPQTKSKK